MVYGLPITSHTSELWVMLTLRLQYTQHYRPSHQADRHAIMTTDDSGLVITHTRHILLQRVSIACYAERCISYDRFCLTVRLTVTVRYHAKTTPAMIMRSSLEDSPMILVSSTLDFTAKFQREHGERGRRMREG